MNDIAIIGGGPAGLTAGLYAARGGYKTVLFEKAATGGLVITTAHIENYPGFENGVNGFELMQALEKQATGFGLQIINSEITAITKNAEYDFTLTPASGDPQGHPVGEKHRASALIIAAGTTYRKLNVPGEKELYSKGVSFCATCDGPFFKGKDVCVFGGGDSAVEEALFLTNFVRKVTIIHRRDQLRAGTILQQRARANPKIDFIWDTVITGVSGKGKVESINIKNVKTNQENEIPAAALFVFIGFDPNSKLVNGLVKLDESGYIITDIEMKTSLEGVFAAGDIRSKALRQIITACGDGARAYGSAQHYLNSKPH